MRACLRRLFLLTLLFSTLQHWISSRLICLLLCHMFYKSSSKPEALHCDWGTPHLLVGHLAIATSIAGAHARSHYSHTPTIPDLLSISPENYAEPPMQAVLYVYHISIQVQCSDFKKGNETTDGKRECDYYAAE